MSAERVQKILAQAGICSRRKAEELITLGEITINGKVAKLGDKAIWGKDAIKVKGKLLHRKEPPVYLAFYKPKNVISMMTDPQDRPNLADYFRKVEARIFPVGRLDFTSEGLILLTNDGDIAEKLQKSPEIFKTYTVKVKGQLDEEKMARLKRGRERPFSIRKMSEELANKALLEVIVRGGSSFDVRAFFEKRGFLVDRICRTSIGHLTLRGMKPGEFRYLRLSQVEAILNQPELAERLLKLPD